MTMVPACQRHPKQHLSPQQACRQSQNHASNLGYQHHLLLPDRQHLIDCSNSASSCTSENTLFGGVNHISYDCHNYSYYYCDQSCLGSDFLVVSPHGQMADDHHQQQQESRTNSTNDEAGSTSSKDRKADRAEPGDDEGWLQLRIGSQPHGCEQQLTSERASSQSNRHINDDQDLDHAQQHHAVGPNMLPSTSTDSGLVELDLISAGPGSHSLQLFKPPFFQFRPIFHRIPEIHGPTRPVVSYDYTIGRQGESASVASSSFGGPRPPYIQQSPGNGSSSLLLHHQEINWTGTFWPAASTPQYSVGMMPSSLSSSSSSSATSFSSLRPLGSMFSRPLQLQFHAHAAGPSADVIRVVDPPRRPHSGLWFILQASQNQVKEPFLPQISKSFLRIGDGRMTVRLLMKYLVNKLKIESESEIEIKCRGQQLAPSLTLQHVRDNIWSRRDPVTLLSDSSSTDHVMVLHYGRSA